MIQLRSYLSEQWQMGSGTPKVLFNPSTEEAIAESSTEGLDFLSALEYGRSVGGKALREMTFAQRGALLKQMSKVLHADRERLLDISRDCNGATRGDSKFDVDGATGTLAQYARYGALLDEQSFLLDEVAESLGSNARYIGQHLRIPRPGIALHINAFNFPAWGTFEKIACSFLAGMPVITKPATATALLTYEMIKVIVDAQILPKGVLSFVAGSAGNLMELLGPQDVVAFTGSAQTAAMLRTAQPVLHKSTRFSAEADSLNAAVLGPDVEVGDDVWYAFIRNVVTDMTQKSGQKCTAVRRVFVPSNLAEDVGEALVEELQRIVVGYPLEKRIRMGPVASKAQLRDVRSGIETLAEFAEVLCGGSDPVDGEMAPQGKGYFVAPTLLKANDSFAEIFHQLEVFGPCATILPYDGSAEQAQQLLEKGEGSLVSSVYSSDRKWLEQMVLGAASWNGRLVVISKKVADSGLPPGMVLPNQIHGGPGRAGGGEELGGLRGLELYTNRVAIQGDRGLLSKVLGVRILTEKE